MNIFNTIVVLLLMILTCESQIIKNWGNFVQPNLAGTGVSITTDVQGNVYALGSVDYNIVIVKYNSGGVELWSKTYDSGNIDVPKQVSLDNSGNVIVVGHGLINGNRDIIIIKYNSIGEQIWFKTFNSQGTLSDYANSFTIDNSNNIYIAGYTLTSHLNDYTVVKYNTNGNLQWFKTYNGLGNYHDEAEKIYLDQSLNIYAVGYSLELAMRYSATIIKYNPNGDSIWVKHIDNMDFSDKFYGMDANNNIYVVGIQPSYTSRLAKINISGSIIWSVNGSSIGNYPLLFVNQNGDSYITAEYVNNSQIDIKTMKYNSNGIFQWEKSYDGYHNDGCKSIICDNSNSVYVLARTSNNYDAQIGIIKYDMNGLFKWVYIDTTCGGEPYEFTIDNNNVIYGTGIRCHYSQNWSFYTAKYSQVLGITKTSTEIPVAFNLCQNYPNPFNPSTKIQFELPVKSKVKIIVYDILGNIINNPVNDELNAGIYSLNWPESKLDFISSGVYFYNMQVNNFSDTRKMLLIK